MVHKNKSLFRKNGRQRRCVHSHYCWHHILSGAASAASQVHCTQPPWPPIYSISLCPKQACRNCACYACRNKKIYPPEIHGTSVVLCVCNSGSRKASRPRSFAVVTFFSRRPFLRIPYTSRKGAMVIPNIWGYQPLDFTHGPMFRALVVHIKLSRYWFLSAICRW